MSHVGFRSRLDDGSINYDITNPSCFFFGNGDTGTGNGAIEDARIVAGKTFIQVYNAQIFNYDNTNMGFANNPSIGCTAVRPLFSITEGKITWSYGTAQNPWNSGYLRYWFVYGGVTR